MNAKTYFSVMGPNFMTPFVIRYVDTERYMIELSEGHFLNDHLYGVSVASVVGGVRDDERSKVFDDLTEAEAHIANLEMEDMSEIADGGVQP